MTFAALQTDSPRRPWPAAVLVAVALVAHAPAEAQHGGPFFIGEPPLARPTATPEQMNEEWYGDDRNVELLAGLLAGGLPAERAMAVADLAETHNTRALPHLRAALDDENTDVRCAAVLAGLQFRPDRGDPLMAAGLDSNRPPVQLTALRAWARRGEANQAALASIHRLATSAGRADVRAQAIATAGALAKPLPAVALAEALDDDDLLVRLAAARHARRMGPDARAVREALGKLVRREPAAVAAEALAALARMGDATAIGRAREWLAAEDPYRRRGGVWAARHGRDAEALVKHLDDPSPMVRLAAIEALGELEHAPARAKLAGILTDVQDEMTHQAAAEALGRIGPEAAETVAEVLRAQGEMLLELNRLMSWAGHEAEMSWARANRRRLEERFGPLWQGESFSANLLSRRHGKLVRNVRSASRLLGRFKSTAGWPMHLRLLTALPVHSKVLQVLPLSLAEIGEDRAVPPLLDVMKACADGAVAELRAMAANTTPSRPHSQAVDAAVGEALMRMGVQAAVPDMLRIAAAGAGPENIYRQQQAAGYLIVYAAETAGAAQKDAVLDHAGKMLLDGSYGPWGHFRAALAAGELKAEGLEKPLRTLLARRHSRRVMAAAAWALQRITSQTPAIPEPQRKQGDWILQVIAEGG